MNGIWIQMKWKCVPFHKQQITNITNPHLTLHHIESHLHNVCVVMEIQSDRIRWMIQICGRNETTKQQLPICIHRTGCLDIFLLYFLFSNFNSDWIELNVTEQNRITRVNILACVGFKLRPLFDLCFVRWRFRLLTFYS